jgi:hypothetical protein
MSCAHPCRSTADDRLASRRAGSDDRAGSSAAAASSTSHRCSGPARRLRAWGSVRPAQRRQVAVRAFDRCSGTVAILSARVSAAPAKSILRGKLGRAHDPR